MDLQHDAKKLGWTLTGAPAVRTSREGSSAGVCVAARAGISVGDIGGSFDLSPPSYPGRLSGAWIQAGPDTGMIFLSVYLHHTEGASLRNKSILKRAISVAHGYGCPWIIAGDFNADPEHILAHWFEALERSNGYIVATKEPTHSPTNGIHRTIDFAICSSQAHDWVKEMQVDLGYEVSPHRAVRMSIQAQAANHLVDVISGPRRLPLGRPIGCPRCPVIPCWLDTGGYAGSSEACNEKWPALIHAVENELCRLHDLVEPGGMARSSYCGRGQAVRIAQQLALPRRTSAALGKVCISAHALIWLARRLAELIAISHKVESGCCLSDGALAQWSRIMAKLTTVQGLPGTIQKLSPEWVDHMESVSTHVPGRDTETLRNVHDAALTTATAMKARHLEQRAQSWTKFVQKQVVSGAAVAHRMIKRDNMQCVSTDTCGVGAQRSASPQSILAQDLVEWRKVWLRLGDALEAPWRHGTVPSEEQPLDADDILRAANTFPQRTSIGCDAVPPSSIAFLSAPLRAAIADLLNEAETSGVWPSSVATAMVHLIPKPGGGRRPIGVLPTLVRIWERARKSMVQKWSRENRRQYDWATQGRSSESAAWHQSILDEAATADGLQSAAVFLDLAKAFETIRLDLVWQAGVQHGFPLSLLRFDPRGVCLREEAQISGGCLRTDLHTVSRLSRRRLCPSRDAPSLNAPYGPPMGWAPESRRELVRVCRRCCSARHGHGAGRRGHSC